MKRVWLITGASRGFGAEITRAVLAVGDRVIATARNKASLGGLAGDDNVLALDLDVTDPVQIRAAVAAGLDRFGRIDVLVNNAGYGIIGAIEECSGAEVEEVYRTNVFGLLNVTRAVLPAMRKRRSGHIINMSSLGGYEASPGWGIYCSTKFAVEGISEALYKELAPLGIRVTVVEPGFFRTDSLDRSSLRGSVERIADYADIVGKTRELVAGHNHSHPGDPARLALAVVEAADAADPPLRLPLGRDAIERIAEKNAFVERETSRWYSLAVSTGYDEAAREENGPDDESTVNGAAT